MAEGNNVSKTWLIGVLVAAFGALFIAMANGARDAFLRLADKMDLVAVDVSAIKAQQAMQGKALDEAKADNTRQFTAIWARIGTHP